MTDLLTTFKAFIEDDKAHEMYIQGVAGTGKTTGLAELITYCQSMRYVTVTCAYTHKAVSVLSSKLPPITTSHHICTLHSYLKKRPTINDIATKVAHVEGNTQIEIPSVVDVVFVDEFSMIGEKDYKDLKELKNLVSNNDEEDEIINPLRKVVYIGDPNQLPPVKDEQVIEPNGNYVSVLTKIYRQENGNKLIDTLLDLNDYINGKPAEALQEHDNFKRETNIIEGYKNCKTSKILLAYTNNRVESLNAQIQGYKIPLQNDLMFSPTVRKFFNLAEIKRDTEQIVSIMGEPVMLGERFKTLETLHDIAGIKFYDVIDEDGKEWCFAAVFGHEAFLQVSRDLADDAVKINNRIKLQFNPPNVKQWAKDNWQHPLARERGKAWRYYLAFKMNVICLDFPHAMTIHKSQGSTYENVYLDTDDIGKCSNNDYTLYLKLLYVAISRASDTVYTN